MIKDERIGQLLLREGVITEEQLNDALEAQQESYGKALGEIMLEQKMVKESDFLRILAKKFHTQYLTTQKLSEIKVPDAVLKLVPDTIAEKHKLFPVQFKKADKTLTIVMVNPDDVAAVDEVKFASGVSNVKALVGFDESIAAAINKWYKNEKDAFGVLLHGEMPGYDLGGPSRPASNLEEDDSQLDLSAIVASSDDDGSMQPEIEIEESPSIGDDDRLDLGMGAEEDGVFLGGMDEMPGDNNLDRAADEGGIVIEEVSEDGEEEVEEVMVAPVSTPAADKEPDAKAARKPDVKKFRLRMLVVEEHESIRKFIIKLFGHEGFRVRGVNSREEAVVEMEKGEYDSLVIKDKDLGEGDEFVNMMIEKFPDVELCSIKDYGSAVIGETRAHKRLMSSFLETLDVVLGLLEMEGGGLQGHSHNTAKYAKLIAAKLDLPQREVDAISLAAYIHEVGRKGAKHRSVIKLDDSIDSEELLEQAEVPLKLLSAAKFPFDVNPILHGQFERWDGKGVPNGLKEDHIPIGSRVLALVESFEDLTSRFTSDDPLEPMAGLEIIKKRSGELFDPKLVDIFLGIVKDDIYLQQMSSAQDRILVVDTEMDQLTLLELRLGSMGLAVTSATNGAQALEKAKSDKPALIITEAALPDFSGFELIEKLKENPDTSEIPFLFISKRDDSNSVNRGFQLGAEDYIIKPIRVEILGAKVNTMINRLRAEKKTAPAAAGVSGSLSEMGLPDIVQILGAGRKTGRITLDDNGNQCTIDMEDGQVVNAAIDDLRGEEAFYAILYWDQGTFSIDPTAEISERLINMANDSLMLEGYRRMDEGVGSSEEDISLDGSDFF